MIVKFMPGNVTQTARKGERILDIGGRAGVMIDGSCAGRGVCGKCRIQITSGEIPPADSIEQSRLTAAEIAGRYRLACRCKINGDITVVVPQVDSAAARKTRLNIISGGLSLTNHITKRFVEVEPATLENQHADAERLISALGDKKLKLDPVLLTRVTKTLKENNHKITAVLRNNEIIDLTGGDTSDDCYGIAFDTGTTTVVGMLWNMNTGESMGVSAVTNPQSVFGADVISRINYASESQSNLEMMQCKIIDCFNGIIAGMEASYQIEASQIYDVTIVGNTTMSHLIMGVNPEQLAMAPFPPVFCAAVDRSALEMGIAVHPLANVHLLPNIAGHVGSDITAGIIATKLAEQDGMQLFVDIGTNGEIVLAKNGRLLTCSTAAGPAFEGAAIYQGMRAAAGAIEKVRITKEAVLIKTIENKKSTGICGSGLIDAVAEMLKSGVIERSGRLLDKEGALRCGVSEALAGRLRKGGLGKEFVLEYRGNEDDIVITQKDIREVQLAKAAIYAGSVIMIQKMGGTIEELKGITVAGAFGSYINTESAMEIGLFPQIDQNNIVSAGNTAGVGASMALLSLKEREEAGRQAERTEHIELAALAEFQEEYIKATRF